MPKGFPIDLTGQRFERWTVLSKAGTVSLQVMWNCRCDCGNETTVSTGNLRSGNSKGCRPCGYRRENNTRWAAYRKEAPVPVDGCLFCQPDTPDNPSILRTATCYTRFDNFPVAPGHMQIVTLRHVESVADLISTEIHDMHKLMSQIVRRTVADGWTIGFNEGVAAGRTVHHVHMHLIPRRFGDVPDPRGGIRNIPPGPSPDAWSTSES